MQTRYETTEVINCFYEGGWTVLVNAVKGIVGQTIDKAASGEQSGCSWGSFTFTSSVYYRAGPNLGNHGAISQTQIECDS